MLQDTVTGAFTGKSEITAFFLLYSYLHMITNYMQKSWNNLKTFDTNSNQLISDSFGVW